MISLVSAVVRVALVVYVLSYLNDMMEADWQAKRLRKRIDTLRNWNERLGMTIMALESEYRELVA